MRIQRDNDKLHITLEACCAIMYVEEHAALLKEAMADPAPLSLVVVDAGDVEEIDTAYLQMLLVLVEEVQRRRVRLVPTGTAPCLRELLDCYGIPPLASRDGKR